jgi:hypothetical protein
VNGMDGEPRWLVSNDGSQAGMKAS